MMPLSDSASVLCALLIFALPFALAGLALFYAGLGSSRSASQLLLGSLCVIAVAAILYFAFGFAWQGYPGGSSYALTLGSTTWDWIGAQKFFFRGLSWNGTSACFIAGFQIFAIGLAALIPWGASSGRWRLSAASVSTILFAGFLYPLFAHWVWGGGWLAHLGIAFNLGGGFVDPGGAATIQVLGAFSALSVLWLVGPRASRPAPRESGRSIPRRHEIYVLAACLLALVGWLAINALGAILFGGLTSDSLVPLAINTLFCASAAMLVAFLVSYVRFGQPDATQCAKGWFAGLVASSAVAAYVRPGSALFVGAVAGVLAPLAEGVLASLCDLDDPAGAVATHGISGLWGLFALGFLSNLPPGQTLAQLVGIGTLIGLMLPIIYGINWLLDRKLIRFRVVAEGRTPTKRAPSGINGDTGLITGL
jgi:Amt family ammonium transporter